MATVTRTGVLLYGNRHTVTVDVPSGTDYEAGGIGTVGTLVGIAVVDAKGGGPVVFAGDGVWRCAYKENERFSVGDKAYLNDDGEIIALPEEAGTYTCCGTVLAVDDTAGTIDLALNVFGETATVTAP